MSSTTRIAGTLVVLWVAQACGGTTSSPPERGSTVTPPGETSGETSGRQPGAPESGLPTSAPHSSGAPPDLTQCPAEEPALDTDCPAEGIVCTYGDGVRVDCRHARRCTSSTWVVDDNVEDCHPVPAAYCPASIPEGPCTPVTWDGQAIDSSGQAVCDYAGGTTCVCNLCRTEGCGGPAWECATPPANPQCPPVAPNLGQPCTTSGVACKYGFPCQGGGNFVCKTGVWYPLPSACF